MALTPDDIRKKRFTSTRFRPGYDEDQVDAFLDEISAELQRLNARIAEPESEPGRT
jgi:DivIVA domain-containing protein